MPRGRLMAADAKHSSLFDRLHCVTGHTGEGGIAWYRVNTKDATFTTKDASLSRPVCRARAQGTMRQTPTDPHTTHSPWPLEYGQQWSVDAYKHGTYSLAGNMYCDFFKDHSYTKCLPSSPSLALLTRYVKRLMSSFGDIHSGRMRGAQFSASFARTQNRRTCLALSWTAWPDTAMMWNVLHHETSMQTVLQSAQLA
jgi:hypothetical protein